MRTLPCTPATQPCQCLGHLPVQERSDTWQTVSFVGSQHSRWERSHRLGAAGAKPRSHPDSHRDRLLAGPRRKHSGQRTQGLKGTRNHPAAGAARACSDPHNHHRDSQPRRARPGAPDQEPWVRRGVQDPSHPRPPPQCYTGARGCVHPLTTQRFCLRAVLWELGVLRGPASRFSRIPPPRWPKRS